MGRKSNEKKNRLRKGDIIRIIEDTFFHPAGYYKVTGTNNQKFYNLEVGSIILGSSADMLGKYLKVNEAKKNIDWKSEEKKFESFFKRLVSNPPFIKISMNELGYISEDDIWDDIEIRELSVH